MSEVLNFVTKGELLTMDIVVDDDPVTLEFKSINLMPGAIYLADDGLSIRPPSELTLVTLKWALTPESYQAVMKLNPSSWDPLLTKMSQQSEADPGKSPGSSSSSRSTARRSKQTSSRSASG